MKLALRRRLGWTYVKGGRLLRVTKGHAVSTLSLSEYADAFTKDLTGKPKPEGRFDGEKWTYAGEGDLAIEILSGSTDALLGHSYLSGQAIQLNHYQFEMPLSDASFSVVTGRVIESFGKMKTLSADAFRKQLLQELLTAKYGPDDVAAFLYDARDQQDAEECSKALMTLWGGYTPEVEKGQEAPKSKCHLMASLVTSNKGGVSLHFQPKDETSDFAATPFQIGLVLTSLGLRAK